MSPNFSINVYFLYFIRILNWRGLRMSYLLKKLNLLKQQQRFEMRMLKAYYLLLFYISTKISVLPIKIIETYVDCLNVAFILKSGM